MKTSQITALKNEAINGGDNVMVAICNVALFGEVGEVDLSATETVRISAMSADEAKTECVRVLASDES